MTGEAIRSEEDRRRFIAENTEIKSPPLVPEIKLRLATEAVPLWEATEQELERRGLPPPFWAFPWAGGQALARYIIDHPELVAGKRVLDIASGGGQVALAAVWASAAHVIAVEVDPFACTAIAMNAEINELTATLEVVHRDMLGEPTSAGGEPLFDIVCAGDVCYEKPMAGQVMDWLHRHAASGATVLVGDPGRTYQPKSGTSTLAHYTVPTDHDLESQVSKETVVLLIDGSEPEI